MKETKGKFWRKRKMKHNNITIILFASLLILSGCGQTSTSATDSNYNTRGGSTDRTREPINDIDDRRVPDEHCTNDDENSEGESPLVFDIEQKGPDAFTTEVVEGADSVLKIHYQVGDIGTNAISATEMKVKITVNGQSKTPRYTTDSKCTDSSKKYCVYGRPADGKSAVMDFSSAISPGAKLTITITPQMSDFHCQLYLRYGDYLSAIFYDRKKGYCNYTKIPSAMFWEGTLTVQVDDTNEKEFICND